MKKFILLSCSLVLVLSFNGIAVADLFVDYQGDDVFFSQNGGVQDWTWTFDLDVDNLAIGDVGSEDDITSALFAMHISDGCDEAEWIDFEFGFSDELTFEVDSGLYLFDVTLSFIEDHILSLTIELLEGDFLVNWAAVVGQYVNNPVSVPEPASVLLMGLGLIGIAGITRKMRKK